MESSILYTVSCDSLEEFEEDASLFASGEPEFVSECSFPKKDEPTTTISSVPPAPVAVNTPSPQEQ